MKFINPMRSGGDRGTSVSTSKKGKRGRVARKGHKSKSNLGRECLEFGRRLGIPSKRTADLVARLLVDNGGRKKSAMRIGSINIRGLGSSIKKDEVFSFFIKCDLDV